MHLSLLVTVPRRSSYDIFSAAENVMKAQAKIEQCGEFSSCFNGAVEGCCASGHLAVLTFLRHLSQLRRSVLQRPQNQYFGAPSAFGDGFNSNSMARSVIEVDVIGLAQAFNLYSPRCRLWCAHK